LTYKPLQSPEIREFQIRILKSEKLRKRKFTIPKGVHKMIQNKKVYYFTDISKPQKQNDETIGNNKLIF